MRTLIAAAMLFSFGVRAQDAAADWKKLEFLLGKWVGVASEKETPLGAGQGGFSFELELSRHVIIRRNHSAYDSGAKHDDLMVIYTEGSQKAIYFDSEGHVIRYAIRYPAKDAVEFESNGSEPGPKYRLSYWMEGASELKGKFEVAPPGGSEYKTYLSWGSKRVAR
jgi:hypothetical protein